MAYVILSPRILRQDRHTLIPGVSPKIAQVAAYVQSHSSPSDFVVVDDLAVADQVQSLPRRAIVEESLANRGGIVETTDLDEAIDLANAFAGEHLCLAVRDPWTWLGKVRHAGGVFLGELNAEAIGDYTAGPSHIMPTGGTARFSSPVNVDDVVKIISVFALSRDDLREAGPPAVVLARAESLEAHARAVECRLAAISVRQ